MGWNGLSFPFRVFLNHDIFHQLTFQKTSKNTLNPTALKFVEALKRQGRETTQDKGSVYCGLLKLSIEPSLDTDDVEKLILEFPPMDDYTENAIYPTLLLSDLTGNRVDFVAIFSEFRKLGTYQKTHGDWNLKISLSGDHFVIEAW